MRRPLALRSWLIGGIVALIVVAYIEVGMFAILNEQLDRGPVIPHPIRDPHQVDRLYRDLESQSDQWADPYWQREADVRLESLMMGLLLIDANDALIYAHPKEGIRRIEFDGEPVRYVSPYTGFRLRETSIYQGSSYAGQAIWFEVELPMSEVRGSGGFPLLFVSAILVILGTIWGAVLLVSRMILKPLGSLSAAAQKVDKGELDFIVPTSRVREVNELARAFDQMRVGLRESIAHQSEMEQERRLFIAAIAHDLRTPLSSIRGYLEGIRDGVARTPERVDRYVAVALQKTGSLESLIEGLFAYTKAEYLNQPPNPEELDLGALLRDAVEATRPRALAKGISFVLDEAPAGCSLIGDRLMLTRVVDNLLDNALRHSPLGGAVTVGWRCELDACSFWVQDTGPGIPEDDLPRLFQPLYRGDQARGSRTGGAGLGLAIAQRLVEAHAGKITAANEDGARFTVTLPRRSNTIG